jgi:membrane protein implicated in regulation of membrane protease activity
MILLDGKRNPMQRRLRLSLLIIISQVLLIALAISWLMHMVTIAIFGSAYFVETNHFILFSEITVSVLITTYGVYILALQIHRLSERRGKERQSLDTERHGDDVVIPGNPDL